MEVLVIPGARKTEPRDPRHLKAQYVTLRYYPFVENNYTSIFSHIIEES